MLRRCFPLFCATGGTNAGVANSRFSTADFYSEHREGTFNCAQVADKLSINPRYAQGLLLGEDRLTFQGRGQPWPAAVGRTSRPGSKACSAKTMFPLYEQVDPEIKFALQKKRAKRLTNQ